MQVGQSKEVFVRVDEETEILVGHIYYTGCIGDGIRIDIPLFSTKVVEFGDNSIIGGSEFNVVYTEIHEYSYQFNSACLLQVSIFKQPSTDMKDLMYFVLNTDDFERNGNWEAPLILEPIKEYKEADKLYKKAYTEIG